MKYCRPVVTNLADKYRCRYSSDNSLGCFNGIYLSMSSIYYMVLDSFKSVGHDTNIVIYMSSSFTTSSTSPPHCTLQCRACNKPITFDNKHISQRTGKKIPLDVQTNEAHDCPARKAVEFPATGNSSPSSQSLEQTQHKAVLPM
jgi:hypothetical protein